MDESRLQYAVRSTNTDAGGDMSTPLINSVFTPDRQGDNAQARSSSLVQKVRRLGGEMLSYRPKWVASACLVLGSGFAASISSVWHTRYNKFDSKHECEKQANTYNGNEQTSATEKRRQGNQRVESQDDVVKNKLGSLGVDVDDLEAKQKAGEVAPLVELSSLETIVQKLFKKRDSDSLINQINKSFNRDDFVQRAATKAKVTDVQGKSADALIRAAQDKIETAAGTTQVRVGGLIDAKKETVSSLNEDKVKALLKWLGQDRGLEGKSLDDLKANATGLLDKLKTNAAALGLGTTTFNGLKDKKVDALNTLNLAKDHLDDAERSLSKKQYHRWLSADAAGRENLPQEFRAVNAAYSNVQEAAKAYKTVSQVLDFAADALGIEALYKTHADLIQADQLCTHAKNQVAMACANVFNGNAAHAAQALQGLTPLTSSDLSTGRNAGKLLELRCALAKTPQGFDALLHLEGLSDLNDRAHQRLAYKSFLEVSGFLKEEFAKSPMIKTCSSVQDLLKEAQNWRRHNTESRMGADNDSKYQLACQALLYSAVQLGQAKPQGLGLENGKMTELKNWVQERQDNTNVFRDTRFMNTCRGGYIAWCNGCRTSGKDSDFDKLMNHLFKFRVHYRRATSHGDRTALNLLKDLGRQFRKTLCGHKKDPLMGLGSTGHMGAGWHLRQEEMFKNSEAMLKGGELPDDAFGQKRAELPANQSVLGQLKEQLSRQLKEQLSGQNSAKAEARLKVIEHWMKEGGRNLRLKAGDADIRSKDLKLAFNRSFSMFRRNPKLHLRTLEKWAVDAYGLKKGEWKKSIRELEGLLSLDDLSNLKAGENRFQYGKQLPDGATQNLDSKAPLGQNNGRVFLVRVAKLRQLANGGRVAGKDRGNLFQFRDLLNLVTGRTPRKTVDKSMMRETLKQYMEGDETGHSVDGHAFGLDIGSPLSIGAGPLGGFGGLLASWSKGRESFITWGDGSHGSEAIFGEVIRTRWELGIRGGLSIAKLDKFFKVGPFGSKSIGKESSKGSAFVGLIPQDRNPDGEPQKNSKYLASKFTDFLVDFASEAKGHENIQNKTDLWAAFCGNQEVSDPTRVGVGLRKFSYDSTLVRTEAGLSARVKWGRQHYGPVVGGTVIQAKGIDSRNDKTSRFQVTRSNVFNEVTAMVSAALSMGGETVYTGEQFSLATRAIPGVGAGVQLAIKTSNAITKLCMENGRVIAAETNRDMVFANARDLMRHLNETDKEGAKKLWLDMMSAKGALNASVKGWNNETKSFASEEEAERAIQVFINNAHSGVASDSNAYTTRQVLHPEVAEKLTNLFSLAQVQEQLLERILKNDPDSKVVNHLKSSLTAINQHVSDILDNQSSWLNKWVTVAATVSKSNSTSVNVGIFFRNYQSVSSRPKSSRIFLTGAQRSAMAYAKTADPAWRRQALGAAAA